jgi:hypothetical protein
LGDKVLTTEDLVKDIANKVDVLIANLNKDASRFAQQISSHEKAIAEVIQVRVNPKFPGISECPDLFRLTSDVFDLAVADVALSRADLPVGAELDAVRRVHVDHLNHALEVLLVGEARHDEQRVAEDQAVGPVDGVPVEVDEVFEFEAVESLEQRHLWLGLTLRGGDPEVLDDHPRGSIFSWM